MGIHSELVHIEPEPKGPAPKELGKTGAIDALRAYRSGRSLAEIANDFGYTEEQVREAVVWALRAGQCAGPDIRWASDTLAERAACDGAPGW